MKEAQDKHVPTETNNSSASLELRGSTPPRDDGGLGKSTKQFNEDVGDETMADATSSAMIDEGDDCDDF